MKLTPAELRDAGLLLRRQTGRTFWHVMAIGCATAFVAHALFAVFFYALGVGIMVWVNGASMLIYVAARLALQRHRNKAAIALIIYLALDAYAHVYPPRMTIPHDVLMLVRWFNVSTGFVMLGLLANVYYKAVLASEHRLRAIASTDPLTGALNRRSMLHEVETARAAGAPSTLLLADIDLFKRINDVFGHEAGDRVLVRTVHAIADSVRPQDRVARWGGEEFLICVAGDIDQAANIAERMRAAVEALRIVDQGRSVSVSLTIGGAARHPAETVEHCVARADEALYLGKQAGRNRVMFAADAP